MATKRFDPEVARDLAVVASETGTMTGNVRAVPGETAVQSDRAVRNVPTRLVVTLSDLRLEGVVENERILARRILMFQLGTKSSIKLWIAI
jgi:hypothetical protein